MKKLLYFSIIFAALFFVPVYFAMANKQPPVRTIDSDCSAGGASQQYGCFKEKLVALDAETEELLQKAVNGYESMWGEKAVAEGRQRILETQESWKIYRHKHCHYGYYSDALAHPASQSARITACEIDKTRLRIEEIKRDYLRVYKD